MHERAHCSSVYEDSTYIAYDSTSETEAKLFANTSSLDTLTIGFRICVITTVLYNIYNKICKTWFESTIEDSNR